MLHILQRALLEEDETMRQALGCALVVAGFVIVGSGMASAEGSRSYRAVREAAGAPVKDCTRFNGRWGYYGNPWCTAAEQAQWDRWSDRRR